MRTAHWKAHLLPLLLLSLHSVSVCLAGICIFDRSVKGLGPQNIATAKEQPTGQDWEPIRIVASKKDLDGPPRYCIKKDGSIHDRSTESAESDCKGYFATSTAEKTKIAAGIIERAIALHTERLLVQRATGPLVIPDLSKHPRCRNFNIPAEHHTTGVTNADMVLYIGYIKDTGDDSPSLGMTCAKSAGGRPIAGALVFGDGNDEVSRHTVRLAAHQIAHALGFSYSEMKSRNMIVYKNVRSKFYSVAVVKSDKTKEMTQAHYGCSTAEGMELEDGEKNNEKLSHWERRNAKDELMATPLGDLGASFMGFYTTLTMAAFEDMGYYKANFQMAEHMEYGYKAGCDFLTGKCMDKGVTKWPNMFCNVSGSIEGPYFCTTDRLGLGVCALSEDDKRILSSHFQYFASPKKSGLWLSLTDYCPVVEQELSLGCTNSKEEGEMPGSLLGKNSMCLDGSALNVKTSGGTLAVDAVCAEISCEGGSVKVKYLGDKAANKWHACPEGQFLTPSSTSDSFVSGTIKCPKYKEVCTVAPDGSSLVPKVKSHVPMEPSPTALQKPTGKPNDPNSGGKSKDSSSVPFGLIPSVAFLVLSFAGYLVV